MENLGSGPDRTWRDADGKSRYHGQSARGRQPIWQLDDQDLDYAMEAIRRAKASLLLSRGPGAEQMPKSQLQETIRAALSQADHGLRFIEEVLDRNNYETGVILTRRKSGK